MPVPVVLPNAPPDLTHANLGSYFGDGPGNIGERERKRERKKNSSGDNDAYLLRGTDKQLVVT